MLIGLGDLGHVVLEMVAREGLFNRIVVCDRDEKMGLARSNLARLSAMAQGAQPQIIFSPLDLNFEDSIIQTVQREKPDIIFFAASLQTWWLYHLLPINQAALIRSAGFGIWLPVHLTLALKLMQALYNMEYEGLVLTAPFPDVVNGILARHCTAPTCGVGNLDELVPKVRHLAAEKWQVSMEKIQVMLVGHHALQAHILSESKGERPPYFLKIDCEGLDITKKIQGDELLFSSYPLPPGTAIHFLTAGSSLRLMKALFSEDDILIHAPGPKGLPGGYPIMVSRRSIQLAPIQGLSTEEAIAINEQSHRFDGIERIEDDGTVVFRAESVEVFRKALKYDCPRLHPVESEDRAKELMERFREFAKKHGVNLPG